MRWLLLKDLQILRRSPLLVALLVINPVVIAVLFGLALSGGPDKPRVAFANLVPSGESDFSVGARTLDVADYAGRLFESIEPVNVKTREEAIEKVRDGEVLGAMVIPENATERLRATLGLGGGDPPVIEVYYNADDPVKRRISEPLAGGAPALVDAWSATHGDAPNPESFCLYEQSSGPPHCCDFMFVTEDLAPRIARIVYEQGTQASDHQPVLLELDL